MLYKLTPGGVVFLPSGASIPANESNRHWIEYQKWLSEGNEPLPLPTDPDPEPVDEIEIKIATQIKLNEAQEKALKRAAAITELKTKRDIPADFVDHKAPAENPPVVKEK